MDYAIYLTAFTTNIITILSFVSYIERRNEELLSEITNLRINTELLNIKMLNMEKDINKLEEFKLKILEKNVVIKQNRDWDMVTSSEEEEEDDEIDD